MTSIEVLASYGIAVFAAVVLGALLLSFWSGIAIGRWRQRSTEANLETTSFVTNGMLGLLAFTLGLTIAMAQGRFEGRRAASLSEANALGTAWLRASAMEHPRAAEIARLLEDYTRLRLDFIEAPPLSAEVARINAETNRMQNLIWGHSAAITRSRTDPVAVALQASLNDVFDQSTAQRWAFAAPLPEELILLLLGMSILTIGTVGFQFGLSSVGEPVLSVLMVGVWTAALVLVADLSTPRFGAVRPDPAPYVWTLQGFQGGITIPPPP